MIFLILFFKCMSLSTIRSTFTPFMVAPVMRHSFTVCKSQKPDLKTWMVKFVIIGIIQNKASQHNLK